MDIEDKLIIAKLMDKIKSCKTKNKIVNSEFLTIYQKDIIKKELNRIKFNNYFLFGGYDGAEGESLIVYPEKLEMQIIQRNLENIIKVIKIKLPKELKGKYSHRDYLGTVMKTGLSRNRIGDIIVNDTGTYIIILKENAEYIADFLNNITKFSKSIIEIVNYSEIEVKATEFEEMKINVSSMRLDNIVSEIVRTSRSKAEIFLKEEKVFINSRCETKAAKAVKENDILVIRGNGKFIIHKISGVNRKGKLSVEVKKYK